MTDQPTSTAHANAQFELNAFASASLWIALTTTRLYATRTQLSFGSIVTGHRHRQYIWLEVSDTDPMIGIKYGLV